MRIGSFNKNEVLISFFVEKRLWVNYFIKLSYFKVHLILINFIDVFIACIDGHSLR